MMIRKTKKGQGALEYLLLIGGAVLIAVIVIALLVGMGSQSRGSAQQQADAAQQATNIPLAAAIISATGNECPYDTTKASFTINWTKSGGTGTYNLYVEDANGDSKVVEPVDISSNEGTVDANVTGTPDCTQTYWAYITTTKNNIVVQSNKMKLTW